MDRYKSRAHGFIDLEASGLCSNSFPIEVGVVLANGASFECLVKPLPDWDCWDCNAEAVHGISRKDLLRHGVDAREVCRRLNEVCRGTVVFSDCWTLDSRWIQRLFAETGNTMEFSCSPIEYILTEQHLLNWGYHKTDTARSIGLSQHRALNDALVIAETTGRLLGSHASWEHLKKLTRVQADAGKLSHHSFRSRHLHTS